MNNQTPYTLRDIANAVSETMTPVIERIIDKKLDEKFNKFEVKFSKLTEEIIDSTARGFNEVSQNFKAVYKRFDGIEERLTVLEKRSNSGSQNSAHSPYF